MAETCFICDAPVADDDGAEVTLTLRDPRTGATTREARVCCDECSDRIVAAGSSIFEAVPALRSVTATFDDGTTVHHQRTEA